MLDAAHGVVLAAFGAPARDRYEVVHEHSTTRVRMEDTGLGLVRSERRVFLQVTSRPRTQAQRQLFYQLLAQRLDEHCGIAPADLVINTVENSDADWSFGGGEAQFLTGELA
jgi:hypothetical protein